MAWKISSIIYQIHTLNMFSLLNVTKCDANLMFSNIFFYKTAYIVNLTFTINIVLQYRWKSKTISWGKRCYTFHFFAFQLSTICLALNKSGPIVVWTSPNWNINCVGIEQSCCGNIVRVLKLQILEFHEQISSRVWHKFESMH